MNGSPVEGASLATRSHRSRGGGDGEGQPVDSLLAVWSHARRAPAAQDGEVGEVDGGSHGRRRFVEAADARGVDVQLLSRRDLREHTAAGQREAQPVADVEAVVLMSTPDDRRKRLEDLRDQLADAIGSCSENMLPQLAGQYRATLADIAALPPVVQKVAVKDDLKVRRAPPAGKGVKRGG
jgi:hypothetical protein